jgi:transmembrane sensor
MVAAAAAAVAFAALRMTDPAPPKPAPEPRTFTTAVAQRAEVRLIDGTRVMMAPGTTLRVAADFGSQRRDVWLEGEAFFDVVHDRTRPFTVRAGSVSAHDLGTAFAVRSSRRIVRCRSSCGRGSSR